MVLTMKSWIVLLLCVFVQNNFAQRTPSITNITPTQIKDIGDTVKLSCTVKNLKDYIVMWMKADPESNFNNLAISTGTSLFDPDPRYSLHYDPASSTYTLQIRDIQETDSAIYICQIVISPSIKVSADVELQVRRPPHILYNSTKSIVASEGKDVQLECYAEGNPPPKISWRRERNALFRTGDSTYQGNTLEIKSITKEDRGTYYCVAENGVGRGTRRNIAVEVEFAPVVTVPNATICQSLHHSVYLQCNVRAYPFGAIVWSKGGVPLTTNRKFTVSHFSTEDDIVFTTLGIKGIEQKDYGQYVCKATNKLGTAEGKVELIESSTPGVGECPEK